jgi:hypothetical protein
LRDRLTDAMREAELLRGMIRLAERAERYRQRDQEVTGQRRQREGQTRG